MFIHHLKQIDWILAGAAILIVLFGLLSIYSASQDNLLNFKKQIIFLILGIFVMMGISFLDYRIFNHSQTILVLYVVAALSLAGLLLLGSEIRGAYSWFRWGPLSLEPVELAKLAIIFFLAKYFSMRHIEIARPLHIFISGGYVLVPTGLVLLQPDLGSALVFLAAWVGIMIVAGIKIRHFVFLSLLGLMVFSLSWGFVLQDYQKARIISFLDPQSDPLGQGYNVIQSIITVGSGGILGKGLGSGSQVQLKFLPEASTDFIFAAISEEAGLAGIAFLFLLYLGVFWQITKVSFLAKNNFARLLCTGFSLVLAFQVFVNIGMNMGILPVTGLPLPFVSYGGSSLLSSFLALGIIQSIKIHS